MTEKVSEYIAEENLIEKGDCVLAGVSGGADSVCLLYLLSELSEKMGFSLSVVHVEHGIRGEESRTDEAFVQKLCDKLEIPCRIFCVNAADFAAETGTGLEEAARVLRYECYEKAAAEIGELKIKIALAHHAGDNAETVLFQMIRGSGLYGLSGIRPMRPLTESAVIIRPLLSVSRGEIEAYLKRIGQDYRTDSTNLDAVYSRNRIRNLVMPEFLQINAQAEAHINRSAKMIRQLCEYMDGQVAELKNTACACEKDAVVMRKNSLENVPEPLVSGLILQILKELAGSAKDFTSVHTEAVMRLFFRQTGRRIILPYGLCAERIYEGVKIGRQKNREVFEPEAFVLELTARQSVRLEAGETVCFDVPNGKMEARIFKTVGELQEISKKRYTKWFDYDRIKDSLQIRGRKSGDYLVIDDKGHKKRLKSWFIDEKIPGEERGRYLLLAAGAHVLWVVGKRISADVKVRESTKRILEIRFYGGNYDEDKTN